MEDKIFYLEITITYFNKVHNLVGKMRIYSTGGPLPHAWREIRFLPKKLFNKYFILGAGNWEEEKWELTLICLHILPSFKKNLSCHQQILWYPHIRAMSASLLLPLLHMLQPALFLADTMPFCLQSGGGISTLVLSLSVCITIYYKVPLLLFNYSYSSPNS